MASLRAHDKIVTKSVTITSGGTTSSALDKSRFRHMAILLPANWVTSVITFTGCDTEDGTFIQMVNADDVVATTIASVAASKCIALNGEIMQAMFAIPFIKIVSAETQTTNDKVIKVTLAP